jgi:hypothetical protein
VGFRFMFLSSLIFHVCEDASASQKRGKVAKASENKIPRLHPRGDMGGGTPSLGNACLSFLLDTLLDR